MTLRTTFTILLAFFAAAVGTTMYFNKQVKGFTARAHADSPPVAGSVSAEGVVEGARPEVALRAEISGSIARVLVKENQQVRKGDLLVELSNASQLGHLAVAQGQVRIAKAQRDRVKNGERKEKRQAAEAVVQARLAVFEQTSSDLKRSRAITRRAGGGLEDYEHKQAAYNQARAELDNTMAEKALINAKARSEDVDVAEGQVAVAEAQVGLAEADLAKTRLRAPCDGVILRVFAEPGEATGPATAQPILILADLSRLRVRAFIEELDIAQVRPGQRAVITADCYARQEFAGIVGQVVPRMGRRAPQSDQPGEYKDLYFQEVLIDLESSVRLPVNLRVRARILASEHEKDKKPAAQR